MSIPMPKRWMSRGMLSLVFVLLSGLAPPAMSATWYVDDINDGQFGSGQPSNPFRSLQSAIDLAASGDTIYVMAGRHVATPIAFTETTCGNCDPTEFYQSIAATRGFRIAGKSLTITGASRFDTVIETRAGYGVLFENAGTSTLTNLTITGGLRDADGRATNGAVVARRTNLEVREVSIVNNNNLYNGSPDPVVGIAGIVGREGASLIVSDVTIHNSSWDGIALYRSDPAQPSSRPYANVRNTRISLGRGVGIAATWDSKAVVRNVSIAAYWKGAGAFGSSTMTLDNSVVRDNVAWGVQASKTATLYARNNVIVRNGTTGLAQWDKTATIAAFNNVIAENGHDRTGSIGPRTGIWVSELARFSIAYNALYANEVADQCTGWPCSPLAVDVNQGNLVVAPGFVDSANNNFALSCSSALYNTGSPSVLDIDGSRSDIGLYGGPDGQGTHAGCLRANLVPTAITASPTFASPGDTVFFDSGIRNRGNGGVSWVNVKWSVDGVQQGYGGHGAVGAGQTVLNGNGNSGFRWTATTPGYHSITFTVNPEPYIGESNYSDNSRTYLIYVSPPLADLTPTAITYNASSLVAGNTVRFDSGVANLKPVAAPGFNIKWFVDGVQQGYGGHRAVGASATVMNDNSAFYWTATRGTHVIEFRIDVDGHVPEYHETNNSKFVRVFVR